MTKDQDIFESYPIDGRARRSMHASCYAVVAYRGIRLMQERNASYR